MFCTPASSSASALNADTAMGTSCSDCSRFCAVTTTSSSFAVSRSCAPHVDVAASRRQRRGQQGKRELAAIGTIQIGNPVQRHLTSPVSSCQARRLYAKRLRGLFALRDSCFSFHDRRSLPHPALRGSRRIRSIDCAIARTIFGTTQ